MCWLQIWVQAGLYAESASWRWLWCCWWRHRIWRHVGLAAVVEYVIWRPTRRPTVTTWSAWVCVRMTIACSPTVSSVAAWRMKFASTTAVVTNTVPSCATANAFCRDQPAVGPIMSYPLWKTYTVQWVPPLRHRDQGCTRNKRHQAVSVTKAQMHPSVVQCTQF